MKIFLVLLIVLNILKADIKSINTSMVISGGVSLGAYEAGYNWAVIRLLKYFNKHSKYLHPNLKSVSGASAGSINALISTIYWCQKESNSLHNMVDDNLFYETWTNIDIKDLVIQGYDPNNSSTLFTRKPLIDKAKKILQHMNRDIFEKNCKIPLGVMVTKANPVEESFQGITIKNQSFSIPITVYEQNGKLRVKNRELNNSKEHFLHTLEIVGLDKDNSKIVPILFASSAFPGAFEQVKLDYKYRGKRGSGYFLDGGVYNNIPLDLAIALSPDVDNFIFIDPDTLRVNKKICKDSSIKSFLHCNGSCENLSPITSYKGNNKNDDELSIGFLGTNLLPLLKSTSIFRSMRLYETIDRYFRFNPQRHLILSSRFHPITGNFMWAFGAFLDKNFREYDYYVGVYDAIYRISQESIKRGFTKEKSLPKQMERYKNILKIDNSKDASFVYNMLLKAEFCGEKPKNSNNRFAAIYNAFSWRVSEKNRYSMSEFKKFLKSLDITDMKVSEDSFLFYAKANPNDWYKEAAQTFINRISLIENKKAKFDDNYIHIAKAVDFAGWLSMGYLNKKRGFKIQPIFIPDINKDYAKYIKLLPTEFAFDNINGGGSFGWSAYWYENVGFLDGLQIKLSYNYGTHVNNHLRLDIDPFINYKKSFYLGAGASVFGNLEKGSFWDRRNAFGANLFIDYNDIFRLTYVRRFGSKYNKNHLYFGIKNISSLIYWLNR